MNQTYFLGANSKDGFASLYRYFPGGPGDFLHIIKGGPGTGKSSFMRCIGQAAHAHGLDVHYVLCSGDPASLDGVYLPGLHLAWMDGTAPHVAEPRFFGVDADYVNLGSFCCPSFSQEEQRAIRELNRQYKGLYQTAYAELKKTAPQVEDSGSRRFSLPKGSGEAVWPARRFLHAISCEGELWLEDEVSALAAEQILVSPGELLSLSQEAERQRLPAIRCPSPLDPMQLEALIFPWAGQAYRTPKSNCASEQALELLRQAKKLHDELEAFYRPYMDFEALTLYTENVIHQLFS